MEELKKWLEANKIAYRQIDNEVVEVTGFGKMYLADLTEARCVFRGQENNLQFNLMESPEVLMQEQIYYIAFQFGRNWYWYDLREKFKFNILKYIGKRTPCKVSVPFVNLGVHTSYELLNGSGELSDWVKKAKYLGQNAIGICDRNTMAATLNLQKECTKAGLKYVFGYSFTLEHEGNKVDMKIYCQSQKGLRNLLRIQKEIMVDSPTNTLTLSGLLTHAEGNVLVFGKLASYWMKKNSQILYAMNIAFDNKIYYQVDLSEYKAERIDVEILRATLTFFNHFYEPKTLTFSVEPILICDNYYLDKDDAKNKIILNKIASGAAHEQSEDQYFKDMDEHYNVCCQLFDSGKWDIDVLYERMCSHTVEIATHANAYYETGKMYMPEYVMLPDEKKKYGNRHRMFTRLLEEGLTAKIPSYGHAKYKERLKEEVYIIESTNNVDYFLIQWDMVKKAHELGIVTGIGRGSAGGSLVSYLLGIISIDPVKYDLIFSRFLVPERCGLNWTEAVSIIGEDIELLPGDRYVEVQIEGKDYRFHKDAEFQIIRSGRQMKVYADQLRKGDDILFDNRDLLWTLNEINK